MNLKYAIGLWALVLTGGDLHAADLAVSAQASNSQAPTVQTFAGLKEGEQAFFDVVGPDGAPLRVEVKVVEVKDGTVQAHTAISKIKTNLIGQEKLQPVVEHELTVSKDKAAAAMVKLPTRQDPAAHLTLRISQPS